MKKILKVNQLFDSELLEYAENHIQYEYDMLFWSACVLAFLAPIGGQGHIGWVVFNGLLNTFSIHARNLIQFLYANSMGKVKQSDVIIEYYVNEVDLSNNLPVISKLLDEVIIKANKQVAHLTVERIEYEDHGKAWNFIEIANEILQIFSKVSEFIPDTKISKSLKEKFIRTKMESPIIKPTIIYNSSAFPIGLEIKILSELKMK
jgi:hypothetical protein